MFEIEVLAPGWEPVARVFRTLVGDGVEPGGEVAVWRRGRPMLIARGGSADAAGRRPWQAGTLVQVYSTGKPIVALAALLAVRAGVVALDEPIVTWWPAYRDSPTTPTTLRHILSHTSGKPAFSAATGDVDPTDADALIRDLAGQPPQTEPGTQLAEHAKTYGHLVEGVLAAAGAPSVREQARRISDALGLTLRFGVADDELDRIAELEVMDPSWVDVYLETEFGRAALLRPPGTLDPEVTRTERWRRASFGASGLQADAVSLARFYDELSDPSGRLAELLGSGLRREAITRQSAGFDLFLRRDTEWGLGFQLDDGEFGMGGVGGSAAWHSGALDYSMAYVTRGLADHSRVDAVAEAVEALLARL